MSKQAIWIVDFGSQYTQLITRKARELGYSSSIITVPEVKERLAKNRPCALILSGGPDSIFDDPEDYSFLFSYPELPTLGICYGMQLLAREFGGKVERGVVGEYGPARLVVKESITHIPKSFQVWMSHSDHVSQAPSEFNVIAESENGLISMIRHQERPLLGLQFHPEVEHTDHGKDVLSYFLRDIADLKQDWDASAMIEEAKGHFKGIDDYVLCGFSGGVDSLVAATLGQEFLGDKLYCFFVDHGLLRPQDYGHIKTLQEKTNLNIEILDAKTEFLSKLKGISEPEKKRKVIGNTFIEVFEKKVHEFEDQNNIHFKYLLQGTLYPDVIESTSPHKKGGKSVTIKSHHNVGGLPERMKLDLLEPLRYLFKDEVRAIGEQVGLEHSWVYRHPFPGPGIGIRVLGEVDEASILKVQASDQILFEELKSHQLYDATWQAFTVLLPVNTVGVKGDARAYEQVICVRMVNSTDGMTAKFSRVSFDFLEDLSRRITNEVDGVTRVVYDITSKPPGTIEWE